MNIAQCAKLLTKLFLDRRAHRGRSEFAFGFPMPFGGNFRLTVKAPGFCRTVVLRRGTSDFLTFEQVFLNNEYNLRKLTRWHEIRALYARIERPLILDLGANVGFASLYFAKNWPKARIIAVEPDQRNIRILKANIEGMSNITPIQGAVASEDGAVEIANPEDEAWALRTEHVNSIGPRSILAYSMKSLMQFAPETQPFIAKIDIEGFESELFGQNTEWIRDFPIIIIELHDWMLPREGSSNNFLRSISIENRDFISLGENIVSIANDGDRRRAAFNAK